jgi:spermidine synthase
MGRVKHAALAVAAGTALAGALAALSTWWADVDPKRYRLDRGHAWVRGVKLPNGERVRAVEVDGTWQGACGSDPLAPCALAYLREFDVALAGDPKAILVLGGGACAWPRHAAATLPETRIDVVEKDAGMAYLATKEFGLQAWPNLEMIVDDAAGFLARADGPYDAIVSDVFSGTEPDEGIERPESIERIAGLLLPGGLYLQNVVCEPGDDDRLSSVVAGLLPWFDMVDIVPASDDMISAHENYVVVARTRRQNDDGFEA